MDDRDNQKFVFCILACLVFKQVSSEDNESMTYVVIYRWRSGRSSASECGGSDYPCWKEFDTTYWVRPEFIISSAVALEMKSHIGYKSLREAYYNYFCPYHHAHFQNSWFEHTRHASSLSAKFMSGKHHKKDSFLTEISFRLTGQEECQLDFYSVIQNNGTFSWETKSEMGSCAAHFTSF